MENKKNPNNPKKQPKQKALALMSRSLRVGQASAPLAVAKFFRPYMEVRAHPKFKDAVVIRGSEYIDQITTPASGTSDVAGRCLCNFYLAPSEFADSRLAQFAKLYEKFRFTKFDLEWEPAVPATQKGTIVIAHDPDIQDPTPPASPQGVRQYCAFEDCAVGPVWSPFKVPCSIKAPDTGYYTNAAPYGTWGGDDRLAFQGQVYVANVSPTALGASQVLGSLIMHYECELFVPQLEDNLQTGHVYNSTTLATAADALKPFLASSAGVTVSDATVGAFQPTDINGTAHLKLQEGLYELTTRYQQNAAGAITLNQPTMIPYEPESAPAPVALIRSLFNQGSNAVGNYATGRWLLNVPRGGAAATASLAAATGIGAGALSDYFVTRLGGYLDDLTTAIY